jgi:hypothetical protein
MTWRPGLSISSYRQRRFVLRKTLDSRPYIDWSGQLWSGLQVMEDFMNNKHFPLLFAQALNEKRVELFDEFIPRRASSDRRYFSVRNRGCGCLAQAKLDPHRRVAYEGRRPTVMGSGGESTDTVVK